MTTVLSKYLRDKGTLYKLSVVVFRHCISYQWWLLQANRKKIKSESSTNQTPGYRIKVWEREVEKDPVLPRPLRTEGKDSSDKGGSKACMLLATGQSWPFLVNPYFLLTSWMSGSASSFAACGDICHVQSQPRDLCRWCLFTSSCWGLWGEAAWVECSCHCSAAG